MNINLKYIYRQQYPIFGRPKTILNTEDHKIDAAFQTDLEQFGGYIEHIYKPVNMKTRTSAFLHPQDLSVRFSLHTIKNVYANQNVKIDFLGQYKEHVPILHPKNNSRAYEGKLRTVLKVA